MKNAIFCVSLVFPHRVKSTLIPQDFGGLESGLFDQPEKSD